MRQPLNRRRFLARTTAAATGLSLAWPRAGRAAASPNDKLLVGIMGCNGRGMDHIAGYLAVPNVEIAYICDVDSRALAKGVGAVAEKQGRVPKGVTDIRRVLDDKSVDAISIAAPDHWHTPAAMLACAAGKHVYVEKPGSHNLKESEWIVAAARKHKRLVQMGNQRRSWPWVIEAMTALKSGELGRVYFARAWYSNHRASIGRGREVPAPDWLDYSLWQGPAPERPYRDNVVHYNWHWFWHWGTGELGNNGVHALDLARWGLGVDRPRRVTCGGNRYHFNDDQETPDVYVTTFDFGEQGIAWEGQSCDPRGLEGSKFGVTFLAEKGSLVIAGNKCSLYDLNDRLIREIAGKSDDVAHFSNFAEAIRSGAKLTAEIEDGQRSTALCHLGNLAWRSGRTVDLEVANGRVSGDKKLLALAERTYRKGWEPKP